MAEKIRLEASSVSSYDLETGDKFIEHPIIDEIWEVIDINVKAPDWEDGQYLCLEAESLDTGRICYFGHAKNCGQYVSPLYKLQGNQP